MNISSVDWENLVLVLRKEYLVYSQEELARLLGVSAKTVSNWETCKASPRPKARRDIRDLAIEKGFSPDLWPRLGDRPHLVITKNEALKIGDSDER